MLNNSNKFLFQHVMLYKWSIEMCPNVKYVLKTDDDVFVDTFHLPRFLSRHQFDQKTNFLLCFVLKGYTPKRNKTGKWYVTKEEYEEDEYPPYCAGPVYVTKIMTMRKILANVETLNYLFIDDVLFTGMAALGVTSHYDWSKSFLESHTDSAEALLSPKQSHYTPELLAAMNLDSSSILHLNQKAKKCHDNPKCYKLLETIPLASTKPKKIKKNYESKSEL